jgi:hypothetical protein
VPELNYGAASSNYMTAAMGSTQPSYSRIAARMEQDPGSIIETCQMPLGYPVLQDIKYWTCLELDTWLKHILDSQEGIIPKQNRFIWRLLPQPPKEPELPPCPVLFRAIEAQNVHWTGEELLFAKHKRAEDFTGPTRDGNWKGLLSCERSYLSSTANECKANSYYLRTKLSKVQ